MKMNWIKLDSPEMQQEMKAASENEKVLVLKFSPKCAINYVVRNLLEREWAEGEMRMKTYIVDVISGKGISAQIEKDYGVDHESPQAIIIDKGKVVFHASHGKVIYSELRKFAK